MKFMRFIFSAVFGCVLVGGGAQSMDCFAPKSSLSSEEKKQWNYVQASIKASVVEAHGSMRSIEKILKYGLAPAIIFAPFFISAPDEVHEFFNINASAYESYQKSFVDQKMDDLVDASVDFICGRVRVLSHNLNNGYNPYQWHDPKHVYQRNVCRSIMKTIASAACLIGVYVPLHMLIGKVFAEVLESKNHDSFKALLAMWHKAPNRIPAPLQQVVAKLYSDACADGLTKEHSAQAILALLAMCSVALTE